MSTSKRSFLFPFLLVLYEIGAYLSNDMYLPALPNISADLHITAHQAQLTLTTWFIGATSLQLIAGPLSDRYGRKPILISSGILYILSTALCALTTDFSLLLLGRFIQGVTVSAAIVAGYSSIHELYDRIYAIRILALMSSITILAPAFGPLVGSIALYFVPWRGIFWIILLWATITTVCLMKWMPETNPPENRKPIHIKSMLQDYGSLLKNWQFVGLLLTLCFTFCGFIAWLTAGPFIVIDQFHYSVIIFGILQAVVFIFNIVANYYVKHLMEKLGVAKLLRIGLTITVIGGLLAALLSNVFPYYLGGLFIAMVIYSFGSGFSFAPLNRLTVEAGSAPMGMRVAMLSTFISAFGTIGTLLVSGFYNDTLASLGYILAVLAILSCLIKATTRSSS